MTPERWETVREVLGQDAFDCICGWLPEAVSAQLETITELYLNKSQQPTSYSRFPAG